jgi:hypothetical protein
MLRWYKCLVLLLGVSLLASSCALPGAAPVEPVDNLVGTMVAATLSAGAVEEAVEQPAALDEEPASQPEPDVQEPPPAILPHAVYYLSDLEEMMQVWRLERDSITQTRITFEPTEVQNFDVSPRDGSVIYMSNNQLYWVDSSGAGRRMLFDGGPVDRYSEESYFKMLSSPRWSPDGRTIAYGYGGIHLYNFETGDSTLILENQVEVYDEITMPVALYFPNNWSPDGSRLLVNLSWFEGGTYGFIELATGELTGPEMEGILCCNPVWTPDSRGILFGYHQMGMLMPGLWRMEAATGSGTKLIPTEFPTGTINYVNWPVQLPGGGLQYFFHSASSDIDMSEPHPMVMTRSGPDGVAGRELIRPDKLNIIDALWVPDGSLALVIEEPPLDQGPLRRGAMLLVHTDGSPIRPLVQSAADPRWGP